MKQWEVKKLELELPENTYWWKKVCAGCPTSEVFKIKENGTREFIAYVDNEEQAERICRELNK